MPVRRKGLLGVKENKKFSERTGNSILSREHGINLYFCSSDRVSVSNAKRKVFQRLLVSLSEKSTWNLSSCFRIFLGNVNDLNWLISQTIKIWENLRRHLKDFFIIVQNMAQGSFASTEYFLWFKCVRLLMDHLIELSIMLARKRAAKNKPKSTKMIYRIEGRFVFRFLIGFPSVFFSFRSPWPFMNLVFFFNNCNCLWLHTLFRVVISGPRVVFSVCGVIKLKTAISQEQLT